MFHVAICDDENVVGSWIEKVILNLGKSLSEIIYVDVYYSGEELCRYLDHGYYYDAIFLDIELKLINGVDVGRRIRNEMKNESTQIIYISANSSYAMDLFKIRPLDFLIKPIQEESVIEVTKKAIELSNKTSKMFQYKLGHDFQKIPIKEILYFKSFNREVAMTTVDKEEVFYGTLKNIYDELHKYNFFYCHKSYLINYNHVILFEYARLIMSNNEVIPISQPKRKKVREMQKEFEKDDI